MGDRPHGAAGSTMPGIVTLFGDNDALDHALSDELGRRGTRTHTVSVETGWLASATHAVVRIDTAAGALALRELTTGAQPPAHVVAVCEISDDSTADRLRELCRQCGEHHDMSLIWHSPLAPEPSLEDLLSPECLPTDDLAATVIDAVEAHSQADISPSFTASTFEHIDRRDRS